MMEPAISEVLNMKKWIEENKGSLSPPVCNKLMSGGQLKIMFVGGPNVRKDYHIEEGEEFFYMVKGDMCLKIVEKGQHKDIVIKEGEIFVLPSRIPHSPQRFADTVGLVIERERLENETDCLRYYCEDGVTVLYEKWFHCNDLVKDLPPAIKEYFSSEQYKTGKPVPGTITDSPPVKIDTETTVHEPFQLKQWIKDNCDEMQSKGMKIMYDKGEFKISVYGGGKFQHKFDGEAWLWQLEGTAKLVINDQSRSLNQGDVALVSANSKFEVTRSNSSIGLIICQDCP